MNIIDEINLLIGQNKISEAIEIIVPLTKTLSRGLYNIAFHLQARLAGFENDEIDGIADPTDKQRIISATIKLLSKIESNINETGEVVALCQEYLLHGKKIPFVDRGKFKDLLKENLGSDGAKLIFVTGDPKSGMSYLENYLIHLAKLNTLFDVVRINAAIELDDPEAFKGFNLAKLLSIKFGLDINFDLSEKDQFKFERFITKLKEKLEDHMKIPIVFIHDFHRMMANIEDIKKLLYRIADEFRQDFPKVIFIIAGLDPESLPNWYDVLRFSCPVYEIENIEENNIRDCLKSIYSNFGGKIELILSDSVTEEEYIESMIAKLTEAPLNIASVGSTISEHLYILNKH